MAIIAVVGNKGGAGKTTLSVNLAAGLLRESSIAVVDADPQGSALQWSAIVDEPESVPVYGASDNLHEQVTTLLQEYDTLVVDCPPSVHAPQTSAVLELGDLALIPVQPSPVDLWATVHIEKAIARAQETNPSLRSMLVINQLESRTILSRLVREALNEISLPVAETAVRRRAIYRNSALEGRSVFDMGRRGADAVEELEQLIREVTQHDNKR
jgi:chromosome partitioning protein